MAEELRRFSEIEETLATPSSVLVIQGEEERRHRGASAGLDRSASNSNSGSAPRPVRAASASPGGASPLAAAPKYPITVPCDPQKIRAHKALLAQLQRTDADPAMLDRMFHARDLRSRLTSAADRSAPACHYERLTHQALVGDEVDIAQESNKVLDSKSVVADLLHKHRDGLEIRSGIEQSVAEWSDRLVTSAATIDTEQRAQEVEQDGDATRKGELVFHGAVQELENGIKGLGKFGAELEGIVHRAQIYAPHLLGHRARTRTTGTLTALSFYSGIAEAESGGAGSGSGVGVGGDETSPGSPAPATSAGGGPGDAAALQLLSDGGHEAAAARQEQVDQVVALEARIARRNESMVNLMRALEMKDRVMKRQKAELKTQVMMREQENTQLRVYIEALQTGQGFTHLWDLEEEESDVARFLKEAMKQALREAQEELKRSIMDDAELVKNKKKLEKLDNDIPTASQLRERAEFRKQTREMKEALTSLKKELDVKDDMLHDREESCRRLEAENATLNNLVAIIRDESGARQQQIQTLHSDVSIWRQKFDECESRYFKDTEALKAQHEAEMDDLRKSVMEMRREVDRVERGAENRAAIKQANIIQRNTELEEAARSLKDLNRALEARSAELAFQLNESLSATAAATVNIVASLRALRSQVQSFTAERDVDTLRQCTWRCTHDTLQDVQTLCASLAMFVGKEPSLGESLRKASDLLEVELVPSQEDDRRLQLERDLAKMTELQQETLLKFRAMSEEADRQREKRKTTMDAVREAVTKLVVERDRNPTAMFGAAGGDDEIARQLRDIFADGVTALNEAEREREESVLHAVQKTTEAQQALVNLCDDTAAPIYGLLAVVSSMCSLVRQTSSFMHTSIAKPVAEWISSGHANLPEGSLPAVQTLLEEVGRVIPRRNNRLIVESLRTRLTFRGRIEGYERQIAAKAAAGIKSVEDAAELALLRRRMNHVERRMFEEHQRIYKEFIRIHKNRCDALLKLDEFAALHRAVVDTEKAIRRSPSSENVQLLIRKKEELQARSPNPASLVVDDDDPTSKSPFQGLMSLSSRRGSRRASMTTFLLAGEEQGAPLSSRSRRSSMGRNSLDRSPLQQHGRNSNDEGSPIIGTFSATDPSLSPGSASGGLMPRPRRQTAEGTGSVPALLHGGTGSGADLLEYTMSGSGQSYSVGARQGSRLQVNPSFQGFGAVQESFAIPVDPPPATPELPQPSPPAIVPPTATAGSATAVAALKKQHAEELAKAQGEVKTVQSVYDTAFKCLTEDLNAKLGDVGSAVTADALAALEAKLTDGVATTTMTMTPQVRAAFVKTRAYRDRIGALVEKVVVAATATAVATSATVAPIRAASPLEDSGSLTSSTGGSFIGSPTAPGGGEAPPAIPPVLVKVASTKEAATAKRGSTVDALRKRTGSGTMSAAAKPEPPAAAATTAALAVTQAALDEAKATIAARDKSIAALQAAVAELEGSRAQSDRLLDSCRQQIKALLEERQGREIRIVSGGGKSDANLAQAESGLNRHLSEIIRTDHAHIALASEGRAAAEVAEEERQRRALLGRGASLLDLLDERQRAKESQERADAERRAAEERAAAEERERLEAEALAASAPRPKPYVIHQHPARRGNGAASGKADGNTSATSDDDDNDNPRTVGSRNNKKKRRGVAEDINWGLDAPASHRAQVPTASPLLELMWAEHRAGQRTFADTGVQTGEDLLLSFIMALVVARNGREGAPDAAPQAQAQPQRVDTGAPVPGGAMLRRPGCSTKSTSGAAFVQTESLRALPTPSVIEQLRPGASPGGGSTLSLQYRDLKETLSAFLAEGRRIDAMRHRMVASPTELAAATGSRVSALRAPAHLHASAHASGELPFARPASASLSLVNYPPVFDAPRRSTSAGACDELIAVDLYPAERHVSDRGNDVGEVYAQMADFFRHEAQSRAIMNSLLQQSIADANAMDGRGQELQPHMLRRKARAASAAAAATRTAAVVATMQKGRAGSAGLALPSSSVASAVAPQLAAKYVNKEPSPAARESDVTRGIPPLLRTSLAIAEGVRPANNSAADASTSSQTTLGDGSIGIRPGSSAFSRKIRGALVATTDTPSASAEPTRDSPAPTATSFGVVGSAVAGQPTSLLRLPRAATPKVSATPKSTRTRLVTAAETAAEAEMQARVAHAKQTIEADMSATPGAATADP